MESSMLRARNKAKGEDKTKRIEEEEQIENHSSSSEEEEMRISCNGCRVLRKACGEDCVISPCLNWITNPISQSHATLFLAKFYGRAGLLNLLDSGPVLQRPAIFRSLLYEACGRIVDPVYGSVGLLHAGNWQLCQSAVDAVLRGNSISPVTSEAAANRRMLHDVRHVSKDESLINPPGSGKVKKTRARSKRTGVKTKGVVIEPDQDPLDSTRSDSHRSSLSHQSDGMNDVMGADGESKRVGAEIGAILDNEEGLELTLAVRPIKKRRHHHNNGGGM